MGLSQLVQAATVLQTPLHTMYYVVSEMTSIGCFFPVEYPSAIDLDEEPIVIMWTGMREGTVPVHFVPLVPETE